MNELPLAIEPTRTRHRRLRWVFIGVGAVAIALLAWVVFHKKPAAPAKPQPVSVSVATVSAQDITVSITALGTAQAWTSDTILAQVSGILLSVDCFWPRSIPRPIRRCSPRRRGRSNATRRCSPARASISNAMPRW
jgi:hypothetical protein